MYEKINLLRAWMSVAQSAPVYYLSAAIDIA
jgi:hypothetical protein